MRMGRLERAYRAFVRCHEVVTNATDERTLFGDFCRVAVEELGFKLAWVGLTAPEDHRVVPVAQAGYEAGYLGTLAITWSDDPRGQGPTGRAIRERTPQVARDIATDERFEPWRADALDRGYASSAALPLCSGAKCFGAISLYATEPNAFDDDEIALLEEVSTELVLGLMRLRAEDQVRELSSRVAQVSSAQTAATAIATVAHDVNNLLATISLCIDTAQEEPAAATRDRALRDAARATASAGVMMRKLLSLSRRVVPLEGHTDVDQVVQASATLLARLAHTSDLRLELDAGEVRARVAPIDLDRILINLVVNAGQVLGSRPIHLRTTVHSVDEPGSGSEPRALGASVAPGAYVVLSVGDSRGAIAPEALARLSDPTVSPVDGASLGLTAVRDIAESVGGGIWVSAEPGGPTHLAVLLPVAADSRRPTP